MKYILILGASSDIAKAVARKYAKEGYNLYLAGRDIESLELLAKDIEVRFEQEVKVVAMDILDYSSHQSVYDGLEPKPYGVVVAVGYLGTQEIAQKDFNETQKIIDTNFSGVVSFLDIVANDFEQRAEGFIVAISSVAGDRGRKSNYIYGASKAALSAYVSGLRNRLYSANVQVLTVKPGFVATKMTQDMDLPQKLTAMPKEVADDIYKAQKGGKDILYTKWIWRYIMLIIKAIPEIIFKRLSI